MRLTQWLAEFRDDVKLAMRQLRASPSFTVIAVITVALGIGANSAIFALVDATLLRPLPFPEPERLVMVWERNATSLRGGVAPLNLLDWNERNRTFDLMAGFIPGVGGMVMTGRDGTAETVPRQWVLAGIFEVLGVRPIVGRTFLPSDDSRRANVVILSEAFWRTRFNADPSVVGRDIRTVIIINETMARRFWPGQDPVGRRMKWGGRAPWMTIVGVIADVKHGPLHTETIPQTVEPYLQVSDTVVSCSAL